MTLYDSMPPAETTECTSANTLARTRAEALITADIAAWACEGMLTDLITRRDAPEVCECDWHVREVQSFFADLGITLDEGEACAVREAYTMMCRNALDYEAELLSINSDDDEDAS